MKDYRTENIVGALALTLSDMVRKASHSDAPASISPAGLTLIGHVPGISIHALSLGLGLSHPGTVRLVDRMAAGGLVERRRSDSDGRAVALHLTPGGKKQEQAILSRRQDVLGQALASLSAQEAKDLARISQKLLTAILQSDDHALRMCRLCDSEACTDCPIDAELDRRSQD